MHGFFRAPSAAPESSSGGISLMSFFIAKRNGLTFAVPNPFHIDLFSRAACVQSRSADLTDPREQNVKPSDGFSNADVVSGMPLELHE
jgi:hypothetical protein